jgi:hypothetical protein
MARISLAVLIVLLAALIAGAAPAAELRLGNFSAGELNGWEVKEFKGRTRYGLVQDAGRTVLKAQAEATASGLVKEIRVDPRQYPLLRWSWKVEGVVAGGDERLKAGDDYAARVYVVFPSLVFWRTRAINYIWANQLPQGQATPNPFSANAMMLAVRSGPAQAGRWLSEERNLLEDYRALFGDEPGEIGAVAVMTDADNTGGQATAYYGDIVLAGPGR